MPQRPLIPLKDSIATQLLKVVFGLYLGLAITITLLQLFAVYMQTKTSVLRELKAIGATVSPGLKQALWEINPSQINSIASGIVQLPAIVGVRIDDDRGDTIQQLGLTPGQPGEATSSLFAHTFPLSYTRGETHFIVGHVTIYSNSGVVFARIRFGFLLLTIAAAIQIVAFWWIFLRISRTKLSRPLAELTHAAEQLDLENLESVTVQVHTSGRNELKILEDTFNAMVRKLLDARTRLYDYANQLHQKQQQLQDILDNATAVIFLKDIEGRYLLINRQYEKTFHISKDELLGKTDYDVFPEDAANSFSQSDQQVITTNAPLEIEESAPQDDGIHTYVSIKFPLHGVDGEIYGICGIATDISERKKAEERIKTLNQELELRVQERTARLAEINILLTESEQRLKEAQRIALLGNWDWNIHTSELFWSDEIYRIFGLAPQEFTASYKSFLSTIHPEDREVVEQAVHAALYENRPYSIDHRIVRPDGAVSIVHEQGEVTVDEQGKPIRMVGTVQDISERKETEEALRASEHQLKLITDNTPAYIAYVGIDDLRYRFVNRSFEIAYGLPREQFIGRHIKEIIGEANYQHALHYIGIVKTGKPVSYVNTFPLEQETRWIQVNYVPDFDEHGRVRAIVVMSHDISEQKNTEILLQHAKEAAEAANRAKSAFLANMSHELRTPLNSILGFAQILNKDRTLTSQQQENAEIIYRNGEHLLTLLNDVLDFTKIEADTLTLHPEKFALPSLLHQLADMTRLNAVHKGLSFVYDAPADLPEIVFADQKRMRQILMNLLGNAVKYTAQGDVTFKVTKAPEVTEVTKVSEVPEVTEVTEVTERVNVAGTESVHLTFEVSDTGVGISPEHLNTIFQPFQQAEPSRLQEGSAGLGLAISRRLVELMGSRLHVNSTIGQGSRFWFDAELPVIDTAISHVTHKNTPEDLLQNPLPDIQQLELPAEWVAAVKQAVEETDLDMLLELFAQIQEREPGLADALTQFVNDFEYDKILHVIEI